MRPAAPGAASRGAGTHPHAREGVMQQYLNYLRELVADHRFLANLPVTYGIVAAMVLVSLIVRRVITHGGDRLALWTGLRWLDNAGKEAAHRARRLIARL